MWGAVGSTSLPTGWQCVRRHAKQLWAGAHEGQSEEVCALEVLKSAQRGVGLVFRKVAFAASGKTLLVDLCRDSSVRGTLPGNRPISKGRLFGQLAHPLHVVRFSDGGLCGGQCTVSAVRKRANSSYSVCMPSPEDWRSGCCRAVRDVCRVCSVVLTVWRPCARKTGRSWGIAKAGQKSNATDPCRVGWGARLSEGT